MSIYNGFKRFCGYFVCCYQKYIRIWNRHFIFRVFKHFCIFFLRILCSAEGLDNVNTAGVFLPTTLKSVFGCRKKKKNQYNILSTPLRTQRNRKPQRSSSRTTCHRESYKFRNLNRSSCITMHYVVGGGSESGDPAPFSRDRSAPFFVRRCAIGAVVPRVRPRADFSSISPFSLHGSHVCTRSTIGYRVFV